MCWEIIARVNLGEFGTFNATHCFGKHKRCAPNPFFHDRVIIPHDSTAGTTLAHVSDGLHTLCGLCLARSRCLAQVCIPAMARRARVKLVTCTCGSPVADAVPMPVFLHASTRLGELASCAHVGCLAFSPNVITIPFVFKRVHMHATSHQPVHMFLQACCTCMLSACDSIPRVFTRT